MPLRPVFRALPAAAVLAAVAALAACTPFAQGETLSEEAASGGDDWVVVTYEGADGQFPDDLMDQLLETELAADRALAGADAGFIDGNDIGEHSYDLYFVGDDREVMWRTLEPVFADAPVEWSRVELRHGFDDASPQVLTRE